MKDLIVIIGILFFVHDTTAQRGFHFAKKEAKSETVSFRLIENMMIVPAEINGAKINLIVDTGANAIFLFNLKNPDSLKLKDQKRIPVKGIGNDRLVDAINSKNNIVKIAGLVSNNQSVQLILDDYIDFSRRLGVPIHGVVGANLFSNFITEIKYSKKKIKFYIPLRYSKNKLKKYETIDLEKHNKRYFIHAKVILDQEEINAKLLLDTGSSDSVWIFKDEKNKLCIPEKYFDDYMGMGIGGDIYGKRSRLEQIKLGNYKVEDTNVSFPDTTHIQLLKSKIGRNGSIGGNLIKRFNLVIDPFRNKLYIKKNYLFNKPFTYNMSGIEIEKVGTMEVSTFNFSAISVTVNKSFTKEDLLKTKEVPIFKIVDLRMNSPAYLAGLKKGDVILSIDNKVIESKKIGEVRELLSFKKEGKEVKLKVSREGKLLAFQYTLISVL